MSLHPDIIDAMIAAGATASVVGAACRAAHDIAARVRHSATERQRAHRGRKRQPVHEPDLVDAMQEQDYGDAAIAAAECHDSHSDKRNPHKENTSSLRSEVKKDGGGDACVTPMISISEEAFAIAEQLKLVAGIDPDPQATPPGWCGAPMWVQGKLNAGIPGAVILAGSRAGMAHKRDGPPRSPRYFDEPIARLMAETTRPTESRPHVHARTGPRGKTNLDVLNDLTADFAAKQHA